ncbi:hypothetical protein NQZ68_034551 [Dissostichus eleginoides]|nr:hypothetical protein NQZ68_034551 [Dissostichus eleginoides]
MATPLDIYDLSLHGDRVERHCCDTLIFLCLCNLRSKWRPFSHLCRGCSDNKPKGTTAEAAVSLPKRRRKTPAPSEEGKKLEDVVQALSRWTGPYSDCVQSHTNEG